MYLDAVVDDVEFFLTAREKTRRVAGAAEAVFVGGLRAAVGEERCVGLTLGIYHTRVISGMA